MDTILFFYRKRGLEKPKIEPVGLKTYLLIRIGLDVERGQWFDKIPAPRPRGEAVEGAANVGEASGSALEPGAGCGQGLSWGCGPDGGAHGLWDGLCRPWKSLRRKRIEREKCRRERNRKRAWEQEEARWLAARELLLGEIEGMMHRLALGLGELVEDMDSCRCVYEDSVRKALLEEQDVEEDARMQEILPVLWKRHFPLEEFHSYTRQFWVEQVLSQAARLPALPSRFVILGAAPGLPEVIEAHAHRMKGLRWILTEAEWDEALVAFMEDFYTEYGLAIELQLLADTAALRRLRLFCREPVNVVDFTGEAYMAVSALPEGSVWMDMLAIEEKRRRILAKYRKITYLSVKEIWKSAQKRCNCPVLP